MDENLSYEDTIVKHRKERKELIAVTQKMKHGVSKGDKKRKKEVNVEIAKMFADLDLKQSDELKEFPEQLRNLEIDDLEPMRETNTEEESSGSTPNLSMSSNSTDTDSALSSSPKISKAQKRRNRKSEQAKEREKAIQEQEAMNVTGIRSLEMSHIAEKLAARDLVLHEIPSDGNCLYNAIEHQLSILNLQKLSMKSLRTLTASYLRSHKEEFIPFLVTSDGDCFSDEQFDKYCEDIANTSAWGGHVEVQILSRVCGRAIEIIQAESPSIIAGNLSDNPKMIISYHRHAYGLGEHYNSIVPRSLKI